MQLSAIIWNANPEIIGLGNLSIRWYGVFFALAFFFGYYIFVRFFKKEKLDVKILDKLALYMVIGTVVGARLGHCLFYEPDYYLSNPLEILKIYKGGLASHGAAIGILLVLYLFIRKYKWSFLWLLDRIAIVVALSGMFIRSGNLMNSEIYGVATQSKCGFVYGRDLAEDLQSEQLTGGTVAVMDVNYKKDKPVELIDDQYIPVTLEVTFGKREKDEEKLNAFVGNILTRIIEKQPAYHDEVNIVPRNKDNIPFELKLNKDKNYTATIPVYGIPRHPSQIYEASAYLFIFLLLMFLYYRKDAKVEKGLFVGLFFVLVFLARFLIEYVKEEQVEFEKGMSLNMGQWLSLPFILAGGALLYYAFKKKEFGSQRITTGKDASSNKSDDTGS